MILRGGNDQALKLSGSIPSCCTLHLLRIANAKQDGCFIFRSAKPSFGVSNSKKIIAFSCGGRRNLVDKHFKDPSSSQRKGTSSIFPSKEHGDYKIIPKPAGASNPNKRSAINRINTALNSFTHQMQSHSRVL